MSLFLVSTLGILKDVLIAPLLYDSSFDLNDIGLMKLGAIKEIVIG